jgi:hypothetical protein
MDGKTTQIHDNSNRENGDMKNHIFFGDFFKNNLPIFSQPHFANLHGMDLPSFVMGLWG